MLPSTNVSASYNSFSSYFQVQEWIFTKIAVQPIDSGLTFANKRLMSLKKLPLANAYRRPVIQKVKLLNGNINWFLNGNVRVH